ncbi:hypothetical protein Sango_1698900 [Sesamum angolense]|uniref:Retrotransposon gag domain-containing protein n=1 Tax=Sesamum angolense TaxID=2727404 RepID=A0AAE1WLF1_9LAMI|nr:hypothetical protein Sango_1698900 [Sesamum angolense]
MPRSSRTGELEFDPEIEKTARRLRKETKQLKGEASASSTSKADFELDVPTSSESEEEVMAQNPEWTINEVTSPDLNQQPLCIEYPTLYVDFELKSGLIHLLPTFRGIAGDKAKDWLYSLPSGTIVSWNELKKQFLENYFPASRTTNIRKDISGIRQFSGESFYEYWEDSSRLFEANRSLVDAASGGALYDKTPTEARKLITTMAANNQQFGNRSDNPPRKVHEVSTSVDERLDKLTFLVEKILVGGTQQVKACGICTSSGHFTDACPTLQEEPTMHANAVGGFSGPSQRHDPFSNTYNPGWRDHPNLRYGNQPQNFQRPPYQQPPPPQTNSNSGTSLEDMMKILVANTQQFQQETRASIQNLESQMSQLASSVSRLESQGKLPSQTIINPKQNVSAITMCSEKELQFENSTRRGQAQQSKTGEELKILPKQAKKSNLTHEEHPKVFVPKPPFPERFAKSRKKEEEREILETLRKVEVNIPLLDVIKQVPRYAKFLKELCTNKSKFRGDERLSMGENVSAILQRKLPLNAKIRVKVNRKRSCD